MSIERCLAVPSGASPQKRTTFSRVTGARSKGLPCTKTSGIGLPMTTDSGGFLLPPPSLPRPRYAARWLLPKHPAPESRKRFWPAKQARSLRSPGWTLSPPPLARPGLRSRRPGRTAELCTVAVTGPAGRTCGDGDGRRWCRLRTKAPQTFRHSHAPAHGDQPRSPDWGKGHTRLPPTTKPRPRTSDVRKTQCRPHPGGAPFRHGKPYSHLAPEAAGAPGLSASTQESKPNRFSGTAHTARQSLW